MTAADEVMVTVEGSAQDERVLSVALATADLMDAGLRLVRVTSHPEQDVRAAFRLTAGEDDAGVWRIFEGTSASRVVLEAARHFEVRSIVMATRRASGAGLALTSIMADDVLLESEKPVVLVPPGTDDLPGRRVHFRRILVPLDGSAFAGRALDFLLALPQVHSLELVIVEVVRRSLDVPAAERRLLAVADAVSIASQSVSRQVIVGDDAARAITGAARELSADLIAMSTRGVVGAPRLVLGRIAQDIMRSAETPILLLTPAMLAAHSVTRIPDFEHTA